MYLQIFKSFFKKRLLTKLTPRNIFKISIFAGFLYQLFDLTNDYLKFDHVNQVSIENGESVPSVTICLIRDKTDFIYINETLMCKYNFVNENYNSDCSKLDGRVVQDGFKMLNYKLRYKNGEICFTFFNTYRDKNSLKYNLLSFTFIFGSLRSKIIIHSHYDPSHFQRRQFLIKDFKDNWKHIQEFYEIKLKKIKMTYLPAPYESDCFDYSKNQRDNVWPRSQFDCMLEYMRQKEIKKFENTYFWTQKTVDFINCGLSFRNISKKYHVPLDNTLKDICKINCHITQYIPSYLVNFEIPSRYVDDIVKFEPKTRVG